MVRPPAGMLAWRSGLQTPGKEAPGDQDRGVIVDRARRELQAHRNEPAPPARRVFGKVERPRPAGRLELVDAVDRQAEVPSAALTGDAFVPRPSAIARDAMARREISDAASERSIGSMPRSTTLAGVSSSGVSGLAAARIDAEHAAAALTGAASVR